MMSDEEEFKVLLARAELLVTEAKEILRESEMREIKEARMAVESANRTVLRSEWGLLISGILIGISIGILITNWLF